MDLFPNHRFLSKLLVLYSVLNYSQRIVVCWDSLAGLLLLSELRFPKSFIFVDNEVVCCARCCLFPQHLLLLLQDALFPSLWSRREMIYT